MDPTHETLDTHQKALELNLDASKYGSLAEIGAGQEVSRWFFRVGAAAGTVARTLSAYDMAVSDDIYGRSSRYVARDRLDAMLRVEYAQLQEQLAASRGADTTFFAFADTVSARNYQGTNVCHGWMGVRFQHEVGAEPSTVRLHLCLRDDTNLLQQQAVGTLGINLIHAAFFRRDGLTRFLESLHEELGPERVEIDHIELEGDGFDDYDPTELSLAVLRTGLTPAIMLAPGQPTHDPMSTLYRAPVVAERGSFGNATSIYRRLLDAAQARLREENPESRRSPIGIYEISIDNPTKPAGLENQEVLARVDRLAQDGTPVLVTRFRETYHLTDYLKRFTDQPIAYTLGLFNLMEILSPAYHEAIGGDMVEAVHRMIGSQVRILVSPMEAALVATEMKSLPDGSTAWTLPESGTASIENTEPTGSFRHLYRYLREVGALVTLPI